MIDIILKWVTNNPESIVFTFEDYPEIIVSNWDFLNCRILTDKWFVASRDKCMFCSGQDIRENMDKISKSLIKQ